MPEILKELWGNIGHEQSNPSSGPYLPPAIDDDDGGSDYSDMDLDTPGGPRQGRILALLAPNPLDSGDELSTAQGAGTCTWEPIRGGELLVAQKAFNSLEVSSKAVPIMGRYIGAAVKAGFALVEIVQAMGGGRKSLLND
ncbi:hypothetical protein M407DRAFT_25667 [Tulasnella calospora MUT 4182]|uniref:Uncharacterized protein n=1 Tax=Tulasnella calospora MUT 4182 TaxID=1051891 RepID=A0A0C3LUG1_9AGAM|nr:hypothetical protein M407DRAFT_25667 [Tulasnella calospora MUT 4182]